MALPSNSAQREYDKFVEDADGNVAVRSQVSSGDIEIGAVEIKDHDSTTRANVSANGLEVDVKASELPSGAATEAKQDDIISNQTDGTQLSKIKETIPTDTSKNNGSLVLAYDVDGNLSTITKTIGASQYQKVLSYTGGLLSGVSSWTQV